MSGGCSGPALSLALDEKKETDTVYEYEDLSFLVDDAVTAACGAIKVDYIQQTSGCGCSGGEGSGFSVTAEKPLAVKGGGCGGSCGSGPAVEFFVGQRRAIHGNNCGRRGFSPWPQSFWCGKIYSRVRRTPAATAEPMTPATLGPMACMIRWFCGLASRPTLLTTLAAIGTAETPAAPIRGFKGVEDILFISLAIRTPPAVPMPKARIPRTRMPMVSRLRNLSATTLMPRARVCRSTAGPTSARKRVHHVEGRLSAVKKQTLEPGSAAGLDLGDAGSYSRLDGTEKIVCQHPGAKDRLKTVTKGCVEESDNFLAHCGLLVFCVHATVRRTAVQKNMQERLGADHQALVFIIDPSQGFAVYISSLPQSQASKFLEKIGQFNDMLFRHPTLDENLDGHRHSPFGVEESYRPPLARDGIDRLLTFPRNIRRTGLNSRKPAVGTKRWRFSTFYGIGF